MQSLKTTRIFPIESGTGSLHDILTGEYSGKPYLSTDMKIPSATFLEGVEVCVQQVFLGEIVCSSVFSQEI